MPTAIKRRKVAATSRNASSPSVIGAFTRVSKASSAERAGVEKKIYDTIATTPYSTIEKKRRLPDVEEGSTENVPAILSSTNDREIKPLPRRSINPQIFPTTPQRPIATTISSSDTPTKGARSLFEQLSVSKSLTKTPTPASAAELPVELLDLINLHASFLTALSLHYAHNGTHSPADVRLVCPDVARAWGKRDVTLLDIRRILGVTNAGIPEDSKDPRVSRLNLSDYGHGKICIEIRTVSGKAGRIPRPVNEDLLNEIFVGGLKASWEESNDNSPLEFIQTLQLEPITTCSSLTKMSPLLAKGQRRLEDFKAGITVKPKKERPAETPTGQKTSLLERLRAKQLHQTTLPGAPSKADLERRAALHRIEDVAAVLAILSTSTSIGQQRVSFTLPTVLGKLRDSFKTPISKEEGTACVRLLAAELAPEWVRIVRMGKGEALVVNREGRPTEVDIKERVKRAAR